MVTQLLYLLDVLLDRAVASDLVRKSHSDFHKLLLEDKKILLDDGLFLMYKY